jgi:hypothetical protein
MWSTIAERDEGMVDSKGRFHELINEFAIN